MDDVQSFTGSSPRIPTTDVATPSKRPRKNSSIAWDHFKRLKSDNVKLRHVRCKWCPQEYISDPSDGTSNMKRHIEVCPGLKVYVPRPSFEQSVFREKLVKIIMKHNLPFSFVEYDAFRDLCEYLNPNSVSISRNTCKSDIWKLHDKTKDQIKEALKNVPGTISLTTDLWTSIATDGYLALIAHYVDENWVLQKRVLNFRKVTSSHSGQDLAKFIYDLLRDWGIEKNILTITVDNASYNDVLVGMLRNRFRMTGSLICGGDYLHVRCGAHVLNLIVQAGLKIIDVPVSKIRECVKYVRVSESRKLKFARCIKEASLTCSKKVIQDMPTRRNSTYLMLESALHFRLAFEQLKNDDSSFKCCPSESEWDKVKQLSGFLKPFQLITTFFSGSEYPTSNLYFHGVWKIENLIRKEMLNDDVEIREMATKMWGKFLKYWECYSLVFSFALILDPRFKLEYLEYCFDKIYVDDICKERVGDVRDKFKKIFHEYECRYSFRLASSPQVSQSQNIGDEFDDFSEFENECNAAKRDKSELDEYLLEKRLSSAQKINILGYWRDNMEQYPILSTMARDILCIPITTVASESTFSIGGRVIGKFRSTLSPDSAEALVCGRDWIYGVEEAQDLIEEEAYIDDFAPLVANLEMLVSS